MDRDDLARLSKAELVEAYLVLQAQLQRPAKTSRTSSKPPSTDRKARREHAKPGGGKPGHEGHSRSLHENPDETVDHWPDVCPQCHGHLDTDLEGDVIGEYDEIEVPLIKPFVRRHQRLCVCCSHCSSKVKAPLPPHGKLRQIEQPVGRSKGQSVVVTNGIGQAVFLKQPLEGGEPIDLSGGFMRFTHQDRA